MGLCLENRGWPRSQNQKNKNDSTTSSPTTTNPARSKRAGDKANCYRKATEEDRAPICGSESEDSDNLPIISVKKTIQPSAEAQTAIAQ